MPKPAGSDTLTHGIRVEVTPEYLPAQSDPEARRFIFSYRIVISNQGAKAAQLRSRHWIIVDAHGNRRDIEGEGVVGDTPNLMPGERYEYSSYCPIETEWGTMEGTYLMQRDNGETFHANIGRFYLIAQPKKIPKARSRVK